MLIKKICCVLLVGVFQSEARKNISYLRVCCITILTQNINIGVPKFTFQLHLQGLVLFNLYVPMQTDQIPIRVQTDKIHIRKQTTRVSRVHVQVTSRLIKLKAAKLRIQEQTRVEKGAKVQRNRRQSTTLLSWRKSGIW